MSAVLSAAQVGAFREQGYVLVRGCVGPAQISALRADLDAWIEESRGHTANYGETPGGKARFDLEAGHSAAAPRLRRVANPCDLSPAYGEVLWQGPLVAAVADLIGPDVRFHHCKLNIKLAGMQTRVDWHQDHAFDPHTNDDMLAALVLLDEMREDNGPLCVVPGSHRAAHYSHYRGDDFVGAIDPCHYPAFERAAVSVTGAPGDVCLMHTWTVHGGPPNRCGAPRRLLICDYTAADAFPLTSPMVPSVHYGRIVAGRATRRARVTATELEMPRHYPDDSFFGAQGQAGAGPARSGR